MAKKKLIYIILWAVAVLIIFLPGFSKLQELKEENRNLQKRIEILTKTNEELKKIKYKLENDPSYVEKIAREKLGMAKKDEIILK
ncbi:MAG: septum formation initiator family protein [Candidatus Omnitrophica bacterium]|nr:septum formation initiator family protein [Candidatus Omnitrophota bacterium]